MKKLITITSNVDIPLMAKINNYSVLITDNIFFRSLFFNMIFYYKSSIEKRKKTDTAISTFIKGSSICYSSGAYVNKSFSFKC